MKNKFRIGWMLGLLLLACQVSAGEVKPKDNTRPRTGSVKFLPGSQESEAARAQRLKRECRGRPNAGACLGYAS